jgi:hypothetical protein
VAKYREQLDIPVARLRKKLWYAPLVSSSPVLGFSPRYLPHLGSLLYP